MLFLQCPSKNMWKIVLSSMGPKRITNIPSTTEGRVYSTLPWWILVTGPKELNFSISRPFATFSLLQTFRILLMLGFHVANTRCTCSHFLGQFSACYFEWIKILKKHGRKMRSSFMKNNKIVIIGDHAGSFLLAQSMSISCSPHVSLVFFIFIL